MEGVWRSTDLRFGSRKHKVGELAEPALVPELSRGCPSPPVVGASPLTLPVGNHALPHGQRPPSPSPSTEEDAGVEEAGGIPNSRVLAGANDFEVPMQWELAAMARCQGTQTPKEIRTNIGFGIFLL